MRLKIKDSLEIHLADPWGNVILGVHLSQAANSHQRSKMIEPKEISSSFRSTYVPSPKI
jgi:hypothetical protein